jgi:serine/threonine protein kinase
MAELKTFLFTDICRSVDLKNEMVGRSATERDLAFIETILTPHRGRIEAHLEQHGGRVVSTAGDGHFLVFSNTVDAAQWAIEVQQSHRDDPIVTPSGGKVEVRISVHVGVPQIDPADADNFVGKTVDYASRLNDYASGGQILVSRSVMAILDDVGLDGILLHLHGRRPLKGIGRVEVHELIYEDSDPRPMRMRPTEHHSDREWTVVPATELYGGSDSSKPDDSAIGSLAPETPLKRVGNYQLEELVGSGGMGDVYKARHIQFGRSRAVKVIKPQFVATGHQEIIRRFYHEIKAIGSLEHKNIVVAIDSSAPADRIHYLVMEYIQGVGLHELVQQHGPLDVADACEIIRQAARGLQYIHGHGMVHRDIKPSNLMLTLVEGDDLGGAVSPGKQGPMIRQGDEAITDLANGGESLGGKRGLVKILDLGLALLTTDSEERLTRLENHAMGTGMYMSPEQWITTSVDIRADIYSLGCTLYHLLAGSPPFYHSDLKPEVAHEKSKIPPIRAPQQIPRKLWDILRKMLAKNAQDRYSTPAEVATALAPLTSGHQLVRLARAYGEADQESPSLISTRPETSTRVDTRSRLSSSPSSRASSGFPRRILLWLGGTVLLAGLVTGLLAAGFWWRPQVNPTVALVRDEIATLPGLNGQWWFHETPWFTPVIRGQFIDAIDSGRRPIGDIAVDRLGPLLRTDQVPQLYGAMEQVSEQLQSRLTKPQRAIGRCLEKAMHTLGSPYRAPYEQALTDTLDQLDKLASPRASDLHLAAVLHHALAQWKEAETRYQEALAASTDEPAKRLRPLILLDYARMQLDSKKYDAAISHFTEARSLSPSPLLSMISLCLEAEAGYRSSRDPRLTHPLKLMAKASSQSPLGPNHPLRAYLLERQGWILNEAWRFSDAIESFDASKRIIARQIKLKPLANQQIPVLEIWARQGEATAINFRDGPDAANLAYRQLVDQIDRTLNYAQDAPQRFQQLTASQRQQFRERLPSICLRLGDCYLRPSRAAEDQPARWDQAAFWYGRCINDCIDLNWEMTDRRARWVIDWRYKQCLPAALSGQLDRAQQLYQQTEQRENELFRAETLLPLHRKTFAFTKHLASALIFMARTDADLEMGRTGQAVRTDPQEGKWQDNGLETLLAEVLELKTYQLGRHKLGNYVLAVEQLAPRLVQQPEQIRKLASHFHNQFVIYSKTGGQFEMLPYLQPTIDTLRAALEQAMQTDQDPMVRETHPGLKFQLENLDTMLDASGREATPQRKTH